MTEGVEIKMVQAVVKDQAMQHVRKTRSQAVSCAAVQLRAGCAAAKKLRLANKSHAVIARICQGRSETVFQRSRKSKVLPRNKDVLLLKCCGCNSEVPRVVETCS